MLQQQKIMEINCNTTATTTWIITIEVCIARRMQLTNEFALKKGNNEKMCIFLTKQLLFDCISAYDT